MTLWGEMFTNGIMQDGALGNSQYPDTHQAFTSGKAAMMTMGTWNNFSTFTIEGLNCSKDSSGFSEDFKYDVLSLDVLDCTAAINVDRTLFDLPEFSFDDGQFDMVLTFWNLHNPDAEGRKNLNEAVFRSLKSGGIYGAVDHTRRHLQPTSREELQNGRRLDPVLVIKEMIDVGFEFVDFSPMHYHPEDDLSQEVGTPGVRGSTDRWTLKFRKP